MSSSSECSSNASWATCGTRLRSAGPFSRATRILLYMMPLPDERDEPGGDAEVVRQVLHVQTHDKSGRGPCERLDPEGIDELAHLGAAARKDDQRHDRERQLKTQN